MLFIMTREAAHEFAGISDAASKDNGRPGLQQVQLRLEREDEKMTLRAVATDSYMLGNRAITFGPGSYDPAKTDDAWVASETGITVEASDWKKLLKDAATARSVSGRVLVDITPELVTVMADAPQATEATLRPTTTHSFPKWEKLYQGGDSVIYGDPEEPKKLPAFNPVYLARIAQIASAKPADRSTYPVLAHVTKQSNTDLAPWLFVQTHGTSRLEVLLMPVRV